MRAVVKPLLLLLETATFIPRRLLINRPKPPVTIAKRAGDLIVLCAGDSLTANTYPKRLQRLLAAAGVEARVLNYGVDGFTSDEYLQYVQSKRLFHAIQPDIVLLQLGTNDVRCDFRDTPLEAFIDNMGRIILRAQDAGATVLLGTIPPVCTSIIGFSQRSVRRATEEINPAIRHLAEDHGLTLVDNHALFAPNPEWLPGIHPTQKGYQAMAENWFAALAHMRRFG